jgi:hypothetical protein
MHRFGWLEFVVIMTVETVVTVFFQKEIGIVTGAAQWAGCPVSRKRMRANENRRCNRPTVPTVTNAGATGAPQASNAQNAGRSLTTNRPSCESNGS